jgi:hypothetical protein
MDPAALDAWTRSALGYAFADPAVLAEALGPTNGKLALVGTAALRALRAAEAFAACADARALAAAVDDAAGLAALAKLGRSLQIHRRASAASDDASVAQATAALLGALSFDGGEPALRRALARAQPEAAPSAPRAEPPRPSSAAVPPAQPSPNQAPNPAPPPQPAPSPAAAARPAPPPRPATPKFTEPPPAAPAWATGEILDAEEEPVGQTSRPSRPAAAAPAAAPSQPSGPTTWLPAGDPGAPPPPASFRKITREGSMNQARSTLADAVAAAFGGGAPSAAGPEAAAPGAYVAEAEPPDPTRPAAVLRLAAWLTAETGDPTAAPAWNDAELGGWGYGSPTGYWRSRVMLPMGFSFTGEGGSREEAREKAAAQACRHLGVP